MPEDPAFEEDPAEQACATVGYGKDEEKSHDSPRTSQLAPEHPEGVRIW